MSALPILTAEVDGGDPDLTILHRSRRAAPALPLEVLGEFWGPWINSAAEAAGAPADYVLGGLLAAAAALIGNSRWISPWSGWNEPPVLWIGQVGDPGDGKSPGTDAVREILRRIENKSVEGLDDQIRRWETDCAVAAYKRKAWEKDVKDAVDNHLPKPPLPPEAEAPDPPTRPRVLTSDATVEAIGLQLGRYGRGLLYHRDELAGWFGQFDKYGGAGGDRAFWLEAYGGRPYVIDRVKHPLPIRIDHLSVGILGGIQPERLAASLLNGEDDGLPSRFLWVWPERMSPRRPHLTVNLISAQVALQCLFDLEMEAHEDGSADPQIISLDEDAASAFQRWREEHHHQFAFGMLASAYAKVPGQLLRLALVLEMLWWCGEASSCPSPITVSLKAIAAAAHLLEVYFKPMAERVYTDAAQPENERLASALAC